MEVDGGDDPACETRHRTDRPVVVAHRAANLGNDGSIPANWRGNCADVVEADVHWFRGRTEVRHSKMLWPTSRLYEGRRLMPRTSARPALARVLDALPDEPQLWVDLKGPDPRLSSAVLAEVVGRVPLWVSARCWWQLSPFRRRALTRTFVSVGSRWQRPLASRAVARGWSDGIVLHERLAEPSFLASTTEEFPIIVWAVQDRARAHSLLAAGVAGLIMDSEELLSQVRADIAAGLPGHSAPRV